MSIKLNPFTGFFDISGSGEGDISALQAQVDALQTQVDDNESRLEQVEKEEYIFDTTDFVLATDQYIFTILATTHQKDSPIVSSVFEENGVDFDEVTTSIKILANNDVQLIVPQSPDLRFNGKLIIT